MAYLRSLAAWAAIAFGQLDGKITTNEVKLGDLGEWIQGLAGQMQDMQYEVERGKLLDAERTWAFEAVIAAVENGTQASREEITRIAQELARAREVQQAADERQTHHEGVSTQLQANIERQGQALATRAKELEQELVNLRAQHVQDVQTLQQVIQNQANEQKSSANKLEGQMAQMMAMLNKLQPTPTHTTPAHPAPQEPEAPEAPDRVQRWTQERWEHENRGQGRRDKGKQPEGASPNPGNHGGRNQGPPRPPPQGNDPNPSDDGSDNGRRGRGGQGPSWRPERADPIDPQVAMIAQAIGLAMTNNGKREASAPTPFKNLKHQNIKLWLLQCKDYFKRNPMQWKLDQDRIKYALGRMEGEDVSSFALTYRKKMTVELDYLKIEGYEYWEMFHIQCTTWFALTDESERVLAAMEKMKYTGNIDKFLLEFENHNTYVGLVGVAVRQMAGRTMPRGAMRRLSTLEYPLDSDWMAALRECTRREEIFVEEQSGRQDHGGRNTDSKRKREDKAVTKSRKQRKIYTAEEKAAYRAKKENERRGTGPAPSKKKVVNIDWTTAHQGIKNSIVKKRKNAKQCKRCGFDRHTWAECYRANQVSTIGSRKTSRKNHIEDGKKAW